MKTAVDALKAGQDDLREGKQDIREVLAKKAEKADIHRVVLKLDKSNKLLQDYEERYDMVEDDKHLSIVCSSSLTAGNDA